MFLVLSFVWIWSQSSTVQPVLEVQSPVDCLRDFSDVLRKPTAGDIIRYLVEVVGRAAEHGTGILVEIRYHSQTLDLAPAQSRSCFSFTTTTNIVLYSTEIRTFSRNHGRVSVTVLHY